MYEAGAVTSFSAQHVMPGMEGPEGRPHSHEYRVEVTALRAEIDDAGMVVDLDVLERAVEDTVAKLQGKNLDDVVTRGSAAAVTVEVLAAWMHGVISRSLDGGIDALKIRVWESESAFGGYFNA